MYYLQLFLFILLPLLISTYLTIFLLNQPYLGVVLVGGMVVATTFWARGFRPINLGMVSLYPLDILAAILVLVASIRSIYNHELWKNKYVILLAGSLAFCFLLFLAGMQRFGLERAGNSARTYIYFLSVAFYCSGIKPSHRYFETVLKTFAWVSAGLLIIAVGRLFLVYRGEAHQFWLSAGGLSVRVINASQTFFLLQTLLMAWFARQYGWKMPLKKGLPYLLIPAIILLQHRTIWVMAGICILLLIVIEKRIRSKLMGSVITGILILAILGVFIYGSQLFASLEGSASNTSTFFWRLEGWKGLLETSQNRGILPNLVGNPFGTGYVRYMQGNPVEVSPHNFYLQVFLDMGMAGIIALMVIYSYLINQFFKIKHRGGIASLLLILLASQLIFFMTYAPSFEQGIILGLAVAVSRNPMKLIEQKNQQLINPAQSETVSHPAVRT